MLRDSMLVETRLDKPLNLDRAPLSIVSDSVQRYDAKLSMSLGVSVMQQAAIATTSPNFTLLAPALSPMSATSSAKLSSQKDNQGRLLSTHTSSSESVSSAVRCQDTFADLSQQLLLSCLSLELL